MQRYQVKSLRAWHNILYFSLSLTLDKYQKQCHFPLMSLLLMGNGNAEFKLAQLIITNSTKPNPKKKTECLVI